jgi:aspartyl-tRNA(Asn)/glutamyl-tRNA(Gln) amidotransferase subunit A
MMSGVRQSALQIREDIAEGRVSAVEVCRAHLDRIETHNPVLNAFNTIARDRALQAAARVDKRRTAGEAPGSLAGVPIALKDNLCVRGLRTTASSKVLDRFIPPNDATVVGRLEAAGAVIVGKTNCDEFAMGSSTENSAYGPATNPWDTTRTPGGSSGGSAAAVSARLVPLALGSDTGGSIRQPASFCGVVGLKPTYGRVSRFGLIAFASSLDQIGPFARTAADTAALLTAIAGVDPCDATTAPIEVPDYLAALSGHVKGIRIGVPRAFIANGVDASVLGAVETALDTLRGAGATLVDIELPHAKYAIPVYYLVCTAEASSNLARYDGVRYGYRAPIGDSGTLQAMYDRTRDDGFGAEVKRRIMLGTYVLSAGYYDAYYLKAQQVRTLLKLDYERAFERVDVVAMPTSPTPPFRLGEKAEDPLQMYLADVFTVGVNLAGLPGISIPCGFAPGRLPIGLQLVGRMFEEATLLRVADAYERLTDWVQDAPAEPLDTGARSRPTSASGR